MLDEPEAPPAACAPLTPPLGATLLRPPAPDRPLLPTVEGSSRIDVLQPAAPSSPKINPNGMLLAPARIAFLTIERIMQVRRIRASSAVRVSKEHEQGDILRSNSTIAW